LLITSDQKKKEDELLKEMREKGKERKQIRDERLEKAEKLVSCQLITSINVKFAL